MSQNPFDNLMQKYGNEAEEVQVAEARAERRHQIMMRVRKVIFLLLFLGVCAAGYVYRADVVQTYTAVRAKISPPKEAGKDEPAAPGANAKNKAKEIQDLAKKRNSVLDDILK
jgi:phosphoribosyl-ATP pyrophosphohydrolase